MTISLVAMATATLILFSDVVFELIEERICSLVGRGGSRAPKRYIYFFYIFINLKVCTKQICMFPSQIIVQIDVSAA